MKGHTPPILFCAGALLANAAESDAPSAEPSSLSTATAASTPANTISPETSARVTAELPKFEAAKVSEEPTDSSATPLIAPPPNNRDTSPGADDIVQLPRYEVRDDPLPAFRERELLTDEGRVALALKRHPGFKLGPLSRLNIRRALEWLAEEQQVERNREMTELISFQRFVATIRSEEPAATE